MAEEEWQEDPTELVPASSPLQPRQPRTPPRQTRGASAPRRNLAASAALAEFNDIPHEFLFSSSPPPHTTPQPVRVEASSARSALGGPGPPSSDPAGRVAAPRIVQVAAKYPWDKEVEQKLHQVFKIPQFRLNQKEAVDETMNGKDGECSNRQSSLLTTQSLYSCRLEEARA